MTTVNPHEGDFLSRKKVMNSFQRHFSTWIPRHFSIDIENVKLTVSALKESSRNVIHKVKSSIVHVFDLEIAHIILIDDPGVDYSPHSQNIATKNNVIYTHSTNQSEFGKSTTDDEPPNTNANISALVNITSEPFNNNHYQAKNILSITDPEGQVEIWIHFDNQSLLTSWEHTLKSISTERVKQRHDQHMRVLNRVCDFIRFKRDQVLQKLMNPDSIFYDNEIMNKNKHDKLDLISFPSGIAAVRTVATATAAASIFKANDYESVVLMSTASIENNTLSSYISFSDIQSSSSSSLLSSSQQKQIQLKMVEDIDIT